MSTSKRHLKEIEKRLRNGENAPVRGAHSKEIERRIEDRQASIENAIQEIAERFVDVKLESIEHIEDLLKLAKFTRALLNRYYNENEDNILEREHLMSIVRLTQLSAETTVNALRAVDNAQKSGTYESEHQAKSAVEAEIRRFREIDLVVADVPPGISDEYKYEEQNFDE